jgi:putative ABC transport system permease protein
MWRITLKNVAAHRVRYWLTGLAVLLGVAFMAGTLVLTDTISQTFDGLYTDIYHGTAAVVRGHQFTSETGFGNQRQRIDANLVNQVRRVPGVQALAVSIEGYAQLVGRNGKPIGNPSTGAPTLGEVWVDVPSLSPYHLLPGGSPPRTASEVVIDKHSADVGHLAVGDSVKVLTQGPPQHYRITGIVKWGTADSPLGASITLFEQRQAARVLGEPGKVDQINVAAEPGVSQEQLVHNLRHALVGHPEVEVASGAKVTQEGQNAVAKALGFFKSFLLVFALVALFVGAFIIFNTFSIVVAQQRRELALLRAVGAQRSQVLAAVLGESLVVGLLASGAGLLAGIGLAQLLKGLLAALGLDIPATGIVVSARTVIVSLAVGTAVTVLSALVPARRASKVAPVAALRQTETEPSWWSASRLIAGAAVLAIGAAVLSLGLFTTVGKRAAEVGVGAAVIFVGVAILGPVVARPLARFIGAPFARRSVTGTLARLNAMRNPRRTSATAAALMVGVALVSLISIIASSTKSSVDAAVHSALRADFIVTTGAFSGPGFGFSPDLVTSLNRLPQVQEATGIQVGIVKINGKQAFVVAVDPQRISQLVDVGIEQGHLHSVTPQGIAVSRQVATDRHLHLGSPVKVTFPATGTRTFVVQAIYRERAVAGDYVLTSAAAAQNFRQQLDAQVYIKLAPGVTPAAGRQAVHGVLAAYPTAHLFDETQYVAQQATQIDQLLNLVYVLLILAVLIALIGIANTLALSVYERTHELGLLRAVGMTRSQLRAGIRTESVVIALIGAIEGLVVGLAFGWAMVRALGSTGVTVLSIPVGQLVIIAVLAGLAGVVAALGPSRRASRLDVLQAITAE